MAEPLTFQDIASIIGARWCLVEKYVEPVLRHLDASPIKAWQKAIELGEEAFSLLCLWTD